MNINSDLPKPEGLFERIIQFSIQNAIWVLLFVCTWIAVGVYSYQKLPIDAVPDITNTQVQINTQAKGFTALEVEQRITYPIENAMAGIRIWSLPVPYPVMDSLKSPLSLKMGLIFIGPVSRLTNGYRRRNLSCLHKSHRRCPPFLRVSVEIYQWVLKADPNAKKPDGTAYTPMDLREIQDWIVRPQLQRVKGVAEVNSIGGFEKPMWSLPI